MADKKVEALKIVEEGLKELESAKGSVAVGVQKLSRAAKLIDEESIYAWAELQLGNPIYKKPVQEILYKIHEISQLPKEEQNFDQVTDLVEKLKGL